MRIFHPVNSMVVNRNLRLILLSNIWLFSNISKSTSNISEILGIPIYGYFSNVNGCWVIRNFEIFSPNISHKTYLAPKLPPGVNFTNILWAALAPKSFCQKNYKPKLQAKTSCAKNFHMKKLLVKYWHLVTELGSKFYANYDIYIITQWLEPRHKGRLLSLLGEILDLEWSDMLNT